MPKKRTESEFIKLFLDQPNANEYEILSKYKNHMTHVDLIHKVCGHKYRVTPNKFIDHARRCPNCFGSKKYDLSEVANIISEVKGYTLYSKEYNSNKDKLDIHHDKCNKIFNMSLHDFKNSKYRCPRCSKRMKYTINDIKDMVNASQMGSDYTILDDIYINNSSKLNFKHKVCGRTFKMSSKKFLTGEQNRCPHCFRDGFSSKGENIIRDFLTQNNILFDEQVYFEDCKLVRHLVFDFAVYVNDDYQFLIEYDGNCHYLPVFGSNVDERKNRLEKQIIRDKVKNKYCIDNDIVLYRIPYKLFDKLHEVLDSLTHPIESNFYKQTLLIAGNPV